MQIKDLKFYSVRCMKRDESVTHIDPLMRVFLYTGTA